MVTEQDVFNCKGWKALNNIGPLPNIHNVFLQNWLELKQLFKEIHDDVAQILSRVRSFNDFTPDNDPYGEHDFFCFDYKGNTIFCKIDYYDRNLQYLSEDPADVSKTIRVMTIMLADEY